MSLTLVKTGGWTLLRPCAAELLLLPRERGPGAEARTPAKRSATKRATAPRRRATNK